MAVGIMAIMSMYLVDAYFLGQVGKEALAALGFIFPVIGLFNSLAFGIGAGASSVIARSLGSSNRHKAQQIATQAILLGFILALALAVTGHATIEPLFTALGAPEQLIPTITQYVSVWYSGCFLVVVPMIGNACIRAAGNARIPSFIMISVAVVNIVLDPILIFGWFGLPALGIQGAAIATICAYTVSFFFALFVLSKQLQILIWRLALNNLVQGLREILTIAVPAIGYNLIAPVSAALMTWLVADHGIAAVAGFSVAARLEAFFIIPLLATASSMGPFMGQNHGANRVDRLQRGVSYGYQFTMIWGVVAALALLLLQQPLVSLFNDDPVILSSAQLYLSVVPWSYGFLGVLMTTSSSATGMGSAMPALYLTTLRLVLLNLPLALMGNYMLGYKGIIIAALLANIVAGLTAYVWFRRHLADFCREAHRSL